MGLLRDDLSLVEGEETAPTTTIPQAEGTMGYSVYGQFQNIPAFVTNGGGQDMPLEVAMPQDDSPSSVPMRIIGTDSYGPDFGTESMVGLDLAGALGTNTSSMGAVLVVGVEEQPPMARGGLSESGRLLSGGDE